MLSPILNKLQSCAELAKAGSPNFARVYFIGFLVSSHSHKQAVVKQWGDTNSYYYYYYYYHYDDDDDDDWFLWLPALM